MTVWELDMSLLMTIAVASVLVIICILIIADAVGKLREKDD